MSEEGNQAAIDLQTSKRLTRAVKPVAQKAANFVVLRRVDCRPVGFTGSFLAQGGCSLHSHPPLVVLAIGLQQM